MAQVSGTLNLFTSHLKQGTNASIGNYLLFLSEARTRALETVGDQLFTVQTAAILEVVHPMLGWVKSGVLPALIQVRTFLL